MVWDEQNEQKLTDAQIKELAECAKKIEAHYGCYMDMEWGVDERDNKVYILQARPISSGKAVFPSAACLRI